MGTFGTTKDSKLKTTSQKNSMGQGYGINRKLSGSSHLSTAVPPHANPRVSPGFNTSRSAVGKTGKKHFSGSKSS
jgi:hypothetical protein